MKKISYLVFALFFVACSNKITQAKLNLNNEILQFERERLQVYKHIKEQYKKDENIKHLMQPKNHKQDCKIIYKEVSKDYISYIDAYWDGSCKNGFANGLGRLFIKDKQSGILIREFIESYENENVSEHYAYDPLNELFYLIANENMSKIFRLSDDDIIVETKIVDFDNMLVYRMEESTLFSSIVYSKQYPNFAYLISYYSQNNLIEEKYIFVPVNMAGRSDGYNIISLKNGKSFSNFYQNGTKIKDIKLDDAYIDYVKNIADDITRQILATKKPLENANKQVELYKERICKDDIRVNFMKNDDYKAICDLEIEFKDIKMDFEGLLK
ncbi:hypothetical protein FMM54_07125 [Campylobacter sp. LR185c]|uniref:hypothetical protein n=1 Tax=Campylobacter sp. LR185c TaxID=2014525 RepID=UPI001237FE17|nr:hypothetical protein [Campylobacter sp. LR185c]KAA6224800.1 hypothetical protein FMM54_07125 [Campylobacter sp. LR185c]KAA8604879.1 hypothetical protein CGP82_00460 [Campylobacter sp. LR185c]